MKNDKSIYDLKLHETLELQVEEKFFSMSIIVLRVPGGWIYINNSENDTFCFVPFVATNTPFRL